VGHLTLIVDDVELSVETGDGSGGKVVLRADDVELRTIEWGFGAASSLEQALTLG